MQIRRPHVAATIATARISTVMTWDEEGHKHVNVVDQVWHGGQVLFKLGNGQSFLITVTDVTSDPDTIKMFDRR